MNIIVRKLLRIKSLYSFVNRVGSNQTYFRQSLANIKLQNTISVPTHESEEIFVYT